MDSAAQACAYCGENRPANVRFCPNCGNPVAARPAVNPLDRTSTIRSPEIREAKSKIAPKTVLFALLLIAIIIAIAALNHTTKSGSSNQDAVQSSAVDTSGESISVGPSLVPFVGCNSDGQSGPVNAPHGKSRAVPMDNETAQRLAYYATGADLGVLAPRGWYCFGEYGSDGVTLSVSPRPINSANLFSASLAGPGIRLSDASGNTFGRYEVAKTIARLFPSHTAFVRDVIAEGVEPASDFPSGPYPNDKLTYKSDEVVEYQTPAHTEGLGTEGLSGGDFRAVSTADPISGVAILSGSAPDRTQLSVRLSPAQRNLIPFIIQQVESDAVSEAQPVPVHDESSHDQNKPPQESAATRAANDQQIKASFLECLAPKVQYGQYSSYDGGKSAEKLLDDECLDESSAWVQLCQRAGNTEDACISRAFGIANTVIRQFGK